MGKVPTDYLNHDDCVAGCVYGDPSCPTSPRLRRRSRVDEADRIANAIGWAVVIFTTLYLSLHVINYIAQEATP